MDHRSSRPLVSVLTPTYNHERFIEPCLESVLSQTYPHWEQIIIDDGSTDRTSELVARFRDPRIRYVRQSHQGIFKLAQTYNFALTMASGSLIATLEGDDVWPPDKLEVLVPAFADPDVVVSYGVCRSFTEEGMHVSLVIPAPEVRQTYGPSALFNEPIGATACAMLHLPGMINSVTATLIRRAALEAIGGFQSVPGLPVADYPTFLELSLQGKFSFTDRIACYWRKHANNTTTLLENIIVFGLFPCALDFVEKHQHTLRLGISRSKIEERWGEGVGRWAFSEGRRLLVGKQWEAARARFRAAFRSPGLDVQAAALCGVVASYLQLDLEALMRMMGRKSLQPS